MILGVVCAEVLRYDTAVLYGGRTAVWSSHFFCFYANGDGSVFASIILYLDQDLH